MSMYVVLGPRRATVTATTSRRRDCLRGEAALASRRSGVAMCHRPDSEPNGVRERRFLERLRKM